MNKGENILRDKKQTDVTEIKRALEDHDKGGERTPTHSKSDNLKKQFSHLIRDYRKWKSLKKSISQKRRS